jgi:hypothetical protein
MAESAAASVATAEGNAVHARERFERPPVCTSARISRFGGSGRWRRPRQPSSRERSGNTRSVRSSSPRQ